MSESGLRGVIDGDPELRSAYGTTGLRAPVMPPRAANAQIVASRQPEDIPRGGESNGQSTELLALVSAAENELHMKSLEALGVHKVTIDKLRKLDGMASSTGSFIAIGLQKTHRLYYLAVVDLKTVADQIKERYLDPSDAVTNEERPFYYRNYIDAVKEFGRAYDLFIQGAAMILKMAGGGDEGPKKTKAKLGFSSRSMKNANAEN